MISIYSEIQYPAYVRRRYEITLTDLQGNEHTDIIGMYNHQSDNDGSEVEVQQLKGKKRAEIGSYKQSVRDGINPFLTDSLWNTRAVLLKAILDDALSLPATDPLVYNGLPYLSLVTDAELMALYSKPQAWVDNVRSQAVILLTNKDGFDAYTPVLGGE